MTRCSPPLLTGPAYGNPKPCVDITPSDRAAAFHSPETPDINDGIDYWSLQTTSGSNKVCMENEGDHEFRIVTQCLCY